MRLVGNDELHQACGEGTSPASPVDDPRGRPLQIFLVRFRTVLGNGAGDMGLAATGMTGNPLALIKNLHRPTRASYLDLLAHQLIRCAVEMPVDIDVVIQVHPR